MKTRPVLLDLFCGAGGAAMGYHLAGFDVVGVDSQVQPRYPFPFLQADVFSMPSSFMRQFHAVHASPPCQRYSMMVRSRWQNEDDHPDLIGAVRKVLRQSKRPFVIENVEGAPLRDPVMLCGTMFKLRTKQGAQLRRHRLFECPWWAQVESWLPEPVCRHDGKIGIGVYGNTGGRSSRDGETGFGDLAARKEAMGIDWMTNRELVEAIPPAYTQYIGNRLLEVV